MSEKEKREQRKEDWAHLRRVGITAFVTIACCILFYFLIYRFDAFSVVLRKLIGAAEPVIYGFVLAYLFNPVMLFFEKHIERGTVKICKTKRRAKTAARGLAITITLIILLLIITLLIAAIVPSVITSVTSLAATLPKNVTSLIRDIQNGTFGNSMVADFASNALKNVTEYFEAITVEKFLPEAQVYLTMISSGVYSVIRSLINFIIGIVVMVYIMAIQDTLIGQCKKIVYAVFKPRVGNIIVETTRKAHKIFGGFIIGKIIDSFIIGVICYIGCAIMHIPSAVLVAVIIGVTNIIPIFGPLIGAIPCLLLVVIQSPWHALYLLIFILVLQQLDGNIIGPKILGSSIGISTFWVIFAILIGGGMFGFLGMVLGVPTLALIYYIVKRIVDYCLKQKGLTAETEEYIKAESVDTISKELKFKPSGESVVEEPKAEDKDNIG